MKIRHLFPELGDSNGELVAVFGAARLFRTIQGEYRLVGGSREERTEANEWVSLFMHEAVLCE